MLTLIQGSARKSVLMEKMYRGTDGGIFIQYGQNVPLLFPHNKEVWMYEPSDGMDAIKQDLVTMLNEILEKTEHKQVFIYGNLEPRVKPMLEEINMYIDGRLSMIVSIQDNSIPMGRIIIDEIK